jgi:CubicO group peptidase (beta-lactamase class C family)
MTRRPSPARPPRPFRRALAASSWAALFFVSGGAFAATPAPAADAPPAPVAEPESVGMSAERLARIGPAMQRYIDANLVPGTVTLVARRGKIVHLEARGARDVESGAPMTTDVIFRIASMTKPITSVALMMLFEEGRFLLNDPISKWLPEYADPKVAEPLPDSAGGPRYRLVPASRPITVRHLLTHTAGFANNYLGLFKEEAEKAGARQKPDDTVADYVTRFAALPLNYQPGERWEYSGATNHVGRLVEILSGMTLDEFFAKRIFEPLGMKDTHFYLPVSKLPRFAAQYKPGEADKTIVLADAPTAESRFVKEPHTFFMGAGGLVSTVLDYFRFQQMMLQGGELDGQRILGRKTVELMTTNHTAYLPIWLSGPGYGFGLGYSVLRDRGAASSMQSNGTFGWGGAFCTYFWVDPAEDVIGILMTQVRPYNHLGIREEFSVLANQAIVD